MTAQRTKTAACGDAWALTIAGGRSRWTVVGGDDDAPTQVVLLRLGFRQRAFALGGVDLDVANPGIGQCAIASLMHSWAGHAL